MTPTTYGAIQPFSAFNFSEKIVTVKIYHGLDISVENTANDNGLMRLTTQLGQLSLIAGLLLIINEFWISLSIGKFYNSARKNLFIPLKQKYTNNVRGEIISVVVHVITLFSVASKLPRPHDFISFGYLFLILVLGVLYGIKKFKEVTSTTS